MHKLCIGILTHELLQTGPVCPVEYMCVHERPLGKFASDTHSDIYSRDACTKLYHSKPETLHCFMGYIVDLSLVMDQLFHITIARAARPLTEKDIDEALENYKEANLGAVHRDIRTYAGKDTIPQILVAGPPAEKVNELIRKYSTDLRAVRGIRAS
ncbi:hypothetical protein B0H16DRAFT_1465356 [Mycena metata]|uniref:Uncharacterized protein n=1 Tax=Mycena metata TaxID=1033252 RepID=A0AAD7MZR5_9AGAR|nr:hypothetical protein B0H16DRAFT_1465356 [Mycena metata]